MQKLKELKENIERVEITYDYEETYNNLYNAVIDYMNETQEWCLEHLFEEFVSYDVAEDIAKCELDNGGLVRLYYFLGDANLNNDLFRINGYGNLTDVHKDDLDFLKEEILNHINDKLEDFSQYELEVERKYDEHLMKTENRGISYGEIAHIQNLSKKELEELEKEIDEELENE